jgi:ABC-2 type transport system permease protein
MTTQVMEDLATGGTEYRLSSWRVVRSEWTKIWSLRSTWWVLGLTGLLAIGLAGAVGWGANQDRESLSAEEALGGAFLGIDGLSLIFGVFGVLLITGEYSSGLIRATLAAVPRRLPVLWAKALVLVAATLPVTVVVAFASFQINQAFVDPDLRFTFGDPHILRATIGAAVAPVALALLGLGVGVILRHTAGTLAVYATALLVAPTLLNGALPESVANHVLPYLPIWAGQALYEVGESEAFPWMLSAGAGALVLAGWIAALLAAGALVLHRRDA